MSQFRFRLRHGTDAFTFTDWEEETHQRSAATRVTELRRQYPSAAIMIEREGDSRTPNKVPMVRFKISVGADTYYSRLVPDKNKGEALAAIREQFPKATSIVEEVIHG